MGKLVKKISHDLPEQEIVVCEFVTTQNIGFQPTPALFNRIEPTGIGGWVDRLNVESFRCDQNVVAVVKLQLSCTTKRCTKWGGLGGSYSSTSGAKANASAAPLTSS